MSARAEQGCSPEELRTLGLVFNVLATNAAAVADLAALLDTDPSPNVRCSLAAAVEALARRIGSTADAASDWCGEGRCIGDAANWMHAYGCGDGPLPALLMAAEARRPGTEGGAA